MSIFDMEKEGFNHTGSPLCFDYRTHAVKWRSRLGAAPLRIHAKSDFLCHFYVII